MRPPQPRESLILRACLEWMGLRGIFAFRANSGGMKVADASRRRGYRYIGFNSAHGVSDIIGILPGGRALYVECKSATGRLRPEQATFLDEVRFHGGIALVVHSVEELDAALAAELRRTA